jgi:outer membrane protein TolC
MKRMKMRITTILLLEWILASGMIWADPAPSAQMVVTPALPKATTVVTLKDCLKRVLAQDPAIRALRFDMEALDRRARAVRASYLPQLIATGQAGYVAGQSTSYFSVIGVNDPTVVRKDIPGLTGYRSGGGQLSMPLINGGSFFGFNTPPAATAREKEKEATGYGYELTTQQILYTVTNTYLSIVASKNKLELLEKQRLVSERQLAMVKGQFEFGLATQGDLDAAERTARDNQLAYETASELSVDSFLQLSLMLGIDNPQTFSIETSYPPMPKLPSYPTLMALIQDHQPSILQQEALLGQARAQLALDQNRIWPTVNFQGNYAYADNFSGPGASLWTAFFTVNVPIFDFGVLHQTARADLASVEAGSMRVEAAKSDLLQNLYAAYSGIRDNTYAAATINSQAAAATKQWKKTEILQKMDAITLEQALTNEQSYIGSRLQQEDTTLRNILAYAQLQSVVGGKWNWLDSDTKPSTSATEQARPTAN